VAAASRAVAGQPRHCTMKILGCTLEFRVVVESWRLTGFGLVRACCQQCSATVWVEGCTCWLRAWHCWQRKWAACMRDVPVTCCFGSVGSLTKQAIVVVLLHSLVRPLVDLHSTVCCSRDLPVR
jgi:hypothetical protein